MSEFTFEVQHSKKTVAAMSLAQYGAMCGKRKVVQLATAAVCLLLGTRLIGNISEPINYLFSLYGCFAIIFINFPANRRTEAVVHQIETAGKGYPCSVFDFEDDKFIVTAKGYGGKGEEHAYGECHRLLEYRDAYYFFLNKDAAFMFPFDCLPEGKNEAFKAFLEQKTGLKCLPLNRWWNATLRSLLRSKKNTR